MTAHWTRWLAWLDALTLRERAIIAVAAVIVVWGAWTVVSWDAIEAERALAEQRLATARLGLADLSRRSAQVAAAQAEDPDIASRQERERLDRQLAQLDRALAERAGQLITPDEMVGALRELLAEQHGLHLERLELLPPASALADEAAEAAGLGGLARALENDAPHLYKHVVEMEWRGGYFETLRYLRAVERLGWALYWEALDYEVVEHPEARVRLRLFTLSEQEGWIGV